MIHLTVWGQKGDKLQSSKQIETIKIRAENKLNINENNNINKQ